MAIAATRVGEVEYTSNEPRYVFERWKLTGTTGAAGDTATCVLHGVGKADFIEGGAVALVSQSGATATIKSLIALGNDAVVIRIYGKSGSGMS